MRETEIAVIGGGLVGMAVAYGLRRLGKTVTVFDEGDVAFRAKAGSILDRFRDEQKTVVIASHNMTLIRDKCTRALWLERGEIEAEGDPGEITRAYVAAAGAARRKKQKK